MNKKLTYFIAIFFLFAYTLSAQHQINNAVLEPADTVGDSKQNSSFLELEIGQLILDETFSKAGSEFQQLFTTKWTWPADINEQFIITMRERPSMGNSTIIEMSINDYKIFESFLQPRYDVLDELSQQAVLTITDYLINYEEFTKQMAGDEMAGSGIY